MTYYPTGIPLSPSYTNPSSVQSALNSPTTAKIIQDVRFASQPVTPIYDTFNRPMNPVHSQEPKGETVEDDEDEDSDSFAWEMKPAVEKPIKPLHRRSQSANELSVRNAKRAHTVVVGLSYFNALGSTRTSLHRWIDHGLNTFFEQEKNYRERLNDKINDLALYLFETTSDCK